MIENVLKRYPELSDKSITKGKTIKKGNAQPLSPIFTSRKSINTNLLRSLSMSSVIAPRLFQIFLHGL
jgi:hypothetical protein